jgi:flagellar basal body-associated protein FliL
MFSLDPFVVSLAYGEGKRLLKVTIPLELSAPEVDARIKGNSQVVNDSSLILLSIKVF